MKTERGDLSRMEAKLRKLETAIAALQSALEYLEKQTLLRLRGEEYCRICKSGGKKGSPRNPPLSKLERTFCKANHGLGGRKPKSSGKKQRLPLDWEEVERLAR